MSDIRKWGTIAAVMVAVVILVQYSFEFVTGQRLLHIDNFILLSGWILMCAGVTVYLWSERLLGKILSLLLICCKLVTTGIVGFLEAKELFLLKTFWTDSVITALLVGIVVYYSFMRGTWKPRR